MNTPRIALIPSLVLIAVAGCFASGVSAAPGAERGARSPSDSFSRWDRNGDGYLSPEEFPRRFAKGLFERIDADGDGRISRKEHEAFRAKMRRRPARRERFRRPLPANVELIADIPYAGTDNPRQRLDLFLPKERKTSKPLPVIVWIHGGAWKGGSKEGGRPRLAPYVASGLFAGVSVGYRLTDEAIWPAQIYDCKAAIRWIRGNAAKYGLDPGRIGVWGSSAGGHLVAMLGTSAGVKKLEGALGKYTDQSSAVTCVVDEFGPTDLLAMDDVPTKMKHNRPDSPESVLVGGNLQEHKAAARSASPITYVTPKAPPFLIIHGTDDPLVSFNQSERFYAALKKAGVDATFIKMIGGGHGGFHSPELDRRIRSFFEKHLLGRDVPIPDDPIRVAR